MVDTNELRRAAKAIYIAVEENVAKDIDRLLSDAANEIDELKDLVKPRRTKKGNLFRVDVRRAVKKVLFARKSSKAEKTKRGSALSSSK